MSKALLSASMPWVAKRKSLNKLFRRDADYILAVKDNQPELFDAVKDYFETAKATDFLSVPVSYDEQTNADHGRVEVRRCCLVNDISTLPQPENWAGLQSIALLEASSDAPCTHRRLKSHRLSCNWLPHQWLP
uniref:Uncharacterized protein n=3 Tax=Candidatus Kentrum sp. LPFa TaxID=2126335 RepID=A0A450XLQ4_9GAMM|nr:MAG: hypothetical protein BECKLPF1236A_GA0070988_107961 [Candidatus Kentron sp. LPFa]